MALDDKLLLIRNCDVFNEITDREYEELNLVHRFKEAASGEYIYFEPEFHNKLYFIKNGFIKIGTVDENGSEQIKEIINKGEIFGQITLEANNLNREFAQAYKSDVSLCAFNVDDFEELLKKKPAIALKFSRHIGNKLRQTENRLLNVLNADVKTRLVRFLQQLVKQENISVSSGIHIPNFFTHDDIAKLIGSSRQTVTTLLNQLETQKLLYYTRSEIVIPDMKLLEQSVLH